MKPAKVFPGAPLADACGNRLSFDGFLAQIKVDGRRWQVETPDYHLDGELVGKTFHAFDVLRIGAMDIAPLPQLERLRMLDRLDGDFLKVPWSTDCRALARYAHAEGHEGIVTKLACQPYGRGLWRKFKKQETLDVVVVEFDRWAGSAAVTLNGVDAGRVFNVPKEVIVGDVIEVIAMEVTKNGKLRHGRFYRRRPDKQSA